MLPPFLELSAVLLGRKRALQIVPLGKRVSGKGNGEATGVIEINKPESDYRIICLSSLVFLNYGFKLSKASQATVNTLNDLDPDISWFPLPDNFRVKI